VQCPHNVASGAQIQIDIPAPAPPPVVAAVAAGPGPPTGPVASASPNYPPSSPGAPQVPGGYAGYPPNAGAPQPPGAPPAYPQSSGAPQPPGGHGGYPQSSGVPQPPGGYGGYPPQPPPAPYGHAPAGVAPPHPPAHGTSAKATAETGRQLFASGLAHGSTAPAAGAGRPIPGLGSEFKMPTPPQPVGDWRVTRTVNMNEDYLLDGSVKQIKFGLGWDAGCDVDGSCLLFDQSGRLVDIVWYGQLHSKCAKGAIEHSGDNRTGHGSGDDETIKIKLRKLPPKVTHILCCVSVYSKTQSLQHVRRLGVRLYHGSSKPKKRGKVLLRYDMSRTALTGKSMLVGMLTRKGAWWGLRALGMSAGNCTRGSEIPSKNGDLLRSLFQASPAHFPRQFTVTITVKEGKGLAAQDANGKSDPFVEIKYRKQKGKSDVVRKTLSPSWSHPAQLQLHHIDLSEAKKVKISVWDWDRFTGNDFMGRVKIPGAALVNLGPGSHKIWQKLDLDRKKQPYAKVAGSVLLDIHVQPL